MKEPYFRKEKRLPNFPPFLALRKYSEMGHHPRTQLFRAKADLLERAGVPNAGIRLHQISEG